MAKTLQVIEIFRSIQGESTLAGTPFAFVRLAGCNLHCRWCDTRYAATGRGKTMSVDEIVGQTLDLSTGFTCITGGEPLLQDNTPALADNLIEAGETVQVETNGSLDISVLPDDTRRIMDVKCPDSGEEDAVLDTNFGEINERDEVKFVIATPRDFGWACQLVRERGLGERCPVLFSPASMGSETGQHEISPQTLAEWILDTSLPIRLQLQLHRILWPNRTRGV